MTELVAHDPRVTVAAGGVAPQGTPVEDIDGRASPLEAHAYGHPAIDGRVVVRLTPDALGAGTDAEMDALGFNRLDTTSNLGLVRCRTLGFPAWPLVHDKKNARFALEVTAELREAKKRAASKPGHARDAFERIAKRLERTVPHFLPSFWEEAGRVLADAGSLTMAAHCFEKARSAERAHALTVDPNERDAVFLEFALLGTLSAKTLSSYAKELQSAAGAQDAYRRFRAIAIRRTLGGLPPWSGMARELRALATLAGLDADDEDDGVIRAILGAPSIALASRDFWAAYRDSLVRLGKRSSEARAQMRSILPSPRNVDRDDDDGSRGMADEWLGVLDEVGALDELPDEGLSAWLGRLVRWAGPAPRMLALLSNLAPRIRDPIPVLVKRGWHDDLDLDLAEHALSLGIPLADPSEHHELDYEHFTCDPIHIARDPRYGEKLVRCVADMLGETEHAAKMRGKEGFAVATHAWLEKQLVAVESGGLVRSGDALGELTSIAAATIAPFPDLIARLAGATVAPALHRTLVGGTIDELGWETFERVVTQLGNNVAVSGAFPYPVLRNDRHATVLGPNGRVILEHDFAIDSKTEAVARALFADGQLLVELRTKKTYEPSAYWSAEPKRRFKSIPQWDESVGHASELPDGPITLGNRAFRAGDTLAIHGRPHLFDGTTIWVEAWQNGKQQWREYDATTDKLGRFSLPTFIESFAAEGAKLDLECSRLQPVAVEHSPLGTRDGMYGLRCRTDAAGWVEAERIDGARVRLRGMLVDALLSLPGDPVPRPVAAGNREYGAEALYAPDGELLASPELHPWARRGFGALVPPSELWHYLTPRDETGSRALRALQLQSAVEILAAAAADLESTQESGPDPATPRTYDVARRLGISHPKLLRGVAGIARRAAELARDLRALADAVRSAKDDPASSAGPGGQQLRQVLTAMVQRRSTAVPDFSIDLSRWIVQLRGEAMRARAPLSDPARLAEARDLISAIVDTGFAAEAASIRLLQLEEDDANPPPEGPWNQLVVTGQGASSFAIHSDYSGIERSIDGAVRTPSHYRVVEDQRAAVLPSKSWMDIYLSLGESPAEFDASHARIVAERTGLSDAEAGLLLLGAPNVYARDGLAKTRRDALGLKAREMAAAAETFAELPEGTLVRVFDRAADVTESSELDGQRWAERLGAAWYEVVGRRARLPPALVARAQKEVGTPFGVARLLSAFAAPNSAGPLFQLDPAEGGVAHRSTPSWFEDDPSFDEAMAGALLSTLCWLNLALPVGDPIRTGIPAIHERLRGVLADPRLVWPLGRKLTSKRDQSDLDAILELVGGDRVVLGRGDEQCDDARDTGALMVARYDYQVVASFRPARLQSEDPTLRALLQAFGEQPTGRQTLALATLINSPTLAELADRITNTPVREGEFEANPAHSAPTLVESVKRAYGVSSDAASLYLQLLALAEPTTKAVLQWNGWKLKQHAAAAAELTAKKLAVSGKRARLQRDIFLPGAFDKGTAPNLPIEDWKRPFYEGAIRRNLPTEPLHTLFERAWKRVESGDRPRFEKPR